MLTIETLNVIGDTKTIIPAEHEVIPIDAMEVLKACTEACELEFSVKGVSGSWKMNECQIWYVMRFKYGSLKFEMPGNHDHRVIKACIAGTNHPGISCGEFCDNFRLRRMHESIGEVRNQSERVQTSPDSPSLSDFIKLMHGNDTLNPDDIQIGIES